MKEEENVSTFGINRWFFFYFFPTTNGGMQNGSSVGIYTHFCTFGSDLHALSVLTNKISASEPSREFIKSALLVGSCGRNEQRAPSSVTFSPPPSHVACLLGFLLLSSHPPAHFAYFDTQQDIFFLSQRLTFQKNIKKIADVVGKESVVKNMSLHASLSLSLCR